MRAKSTKSSSAPRQFTRLPGNHGTPNDLNPGDTYINEAARRSREDASQASPSSRGSSRGSSSASPPWPDVKPGTTVEIAMLTDVIATYLTDRALWRRSEK